MAIEFRCSQCNQLLRVAEDSAGKQARCPKCQSLMAVPAASTAPNPLFGATTTFSSPLPTSGPASPPPKPAADPFNFPNQPGGGAGGTMPPPPTNPFAGAGTPPPPKPVDHPFGAGGFPPTSVNPYASSPVPQGYGPPSQQNSAAMMLAVGSLVTSMMGLLSCACCLFMPFPPISLLLGIGALFQKPDQSARIIAIIGIVLSALSLILFAVMIIVGLAGAAMDPQFQQGFGK